MTEVHPHEFRNITKLHVSQVTTEFKHTIPANLTVLKNWSKDILQEKSPISSLSICCRFAYMNEFIHAQKWKVRAIWNFSTWKKKCEIQWNDNKNGNITVPPVPSQTDSVLFIKQPKWISTLTAFWYEVFCRDKVQNIWMSLSRNASAKILKIAIKIHPSQVNGCHFCNA